MVETVTYTPPLTVKHFIKDHRKGELFYDWIVGPLGSGKTTGIFFKLVYMAKLQEAQSDGIRRTRAVIVRQTNPQLKDTTIKSWDQWFKPGVAGDWKLTERDFKLRFDDVECEVLFRPLDTAQDVDRVLSLEVTFAIIDEFVAIPRAIIDALSGRIGRYPAKKDGGATNWGMWGSSNPSTEDNWWHDYLHDESNTEIIRLHGPAERVAAAMRRLVDNDNDPADKRNIRYFIQPSGQSDEAENIDNLPGGRGYYDNQAIGKSPAWIKQFIDAEWGFSASESPVIKTFLPNVHVARVGLRFDPAYPLVGGLDPGLGGMACIFGQEDMNGRLLVLGEVGAVGMGVTRFLTDEVKPYLRRHFPGAEVIIAPDPASGNRVQTDEVAVVSVIKKHFQVSIETDNRLARRLDAIESYTTRNTQMGPAFLVDRTMCPVFTRALSGGWRYGLVPKGDTQKPSPEKNSFSHYGDAGGYLARYFHKQFEKSGRRGVTAGDLRGRGQQLTGGAAPIYHAR